MKDTSKISKSFTCECGTTNKFEFETDFDVHDVTMDVRCQMCNQEKSINLVSFFRRNSEGQVFESPSLNPQPSPSVSQSIFENAMIPVGDMIAANEQAATDNQPGVNEQPAIENPLAPSTNALITEDTLIEEENPVDEILSQSASAQIQPRKLNNREEDEEEELSYEEKEAFSDLFGKL